MEASTEISKEYLEDQEYIPAQTAIKMPRRQQHTTPAKRSCGKHVKRVAIWDTISKD
jgi:hypothetical protein